MKFFKKLCYQKISIIKMCCLLCILQWKKNQKYSDNFWLRKLALFDTFPLHQFSKFNFFLSNFVPPVWKLDNPYCHIVGSEKCVGPWPQYYLNYGNIGCGVSNSGIQNYEDFWKIMNRSRFIEPSWSIPGSRRTRHNVKGTPRSST